MAIVKNFKQHPPLPPSRYEVGIYCRVSTECKTQIVSVGHQLSGLIADVANSYQARLYWSLDRAAQNPDAQIYNRKCYGYNNAEDGSLVINEPEAEVTLSVMQMGL